ncbi:unnamed protein product [Urochloa humidicola]
MLQRICFRRGDPLIPQSPVPQSAPTLSSNHSSAAAPSASPLAPPCPVRLAVRAVPLLPPVPLQPDGLTSRPPASRAILHPQIVPPLLFLYSPGPVSAVKIS